MVMSGGYRQSHVLGWQRGVRSVSWCDAQRLRALEQRHVTDLRDRVRHVETSCDHTHPLWIRMKETLTTAAKENERG